MVRPLSFDDHSLIMPEGQILASVLLSWLCQHVLSYHLVQDPLMVRSYCVVEPPTKVLIDPSVMHPVTDLPERHSRAPMEPLLLPPAHLLPAKVLDQHCIVDRNLHQRAGQADSLQSSKTGTTDLDFLLGLRYNRVSIETQICLIRRLNT